MSINEVTYEKLKTPLKVNGNLKNKCNLGGGGLPEFRFSILLAQYKYRLFGRAKCWINT